MGTFRFLLALAVVLAHTQGHIWKIGLTGGVVAVQAFFIISGFYISLILNEKYVGKGAYYIFISNRLLRLLPVYWVVSILTIVISLITWRIAEKHIMLQSYFTEWDLLNIYSKIFITFSNITLIGQDWIMFLGIDKLGSLYPVLDFRNTSPQLYTFLVVPQAWTLGVELAFYAISPFIVHRSTFVISLAVISLIYLRYFLYVFLDLSHDPWNYRFFPTELAMFLIGSLSYQLYSKIKNKNLYMLPFLATGVLIAATLIFHSLPNYEYMHFNITAWLFYILTAVSIPFVFIYTKKNPFDRFMGELSYPIYITHVLIVSILTTIKTEHLTTYAIIGSVVVSIFLLKVIIEPIDNFRERRATQLAVGDQSH